MDAVTIFALVLVIAVIAVLWVLQYRNKPAPSKVSGFTESELAALSPARRDKRKQVAKEKKPVKTGEQPQKVVSRKLKDVDGAADADSDEQMLQFLGNRITLEQKRSAFTDGDDSDKHKAKKSHEPAEKPAAGFTAVDRQKKPAKKDVEEPVGEEKKEDEKKRAAKPFFKGDMEAIKKEQEARKAEKEKEKSARPPRAPRENGGAARNVPPRKQAESSPDAAGAGGDEARKERKPRPAGAEGGAPRPRREFTPVAPVYTEPFEEWSIDSMLDSITANPQADKPRAKRPPKESAPAAAAAESEAQE